MPAQSRAAWPDDARGLQPVQRRAHGPLRQVGVADQRGTLGERLLAVGRWRGLPTRSARPCRPGSASRRGRGGTGARLRAHEIASTLTATAGSAVLLAWERPALKTRRQFPIQCPILGARWERRCLARWGQMRLFWTEDSLTDLPLYSGMRTCRPGGPLLGSWMSWVRIPSLTPISGCSRTLETPTGRERGLEHWILAGEDLSATARWRCQDWRAWPTVVTRRRGDHNCCKRWRPAVTEVSVTPKAPRFALDRAGRPHSCSMASSWSTSMSAT